MRSRRAADRLSSGPYSNQVSGVHEAPTQPAPYVEEARRSGTDLGSIPLSELHVDFEPIVDLHTGQTLGFEALPRCAAEGLADLEELYARAVFEKNMGQLGRTLRDRAMRDCAGITVFFPVHPQELKEGIIVRPDDPLCGHDAMVYLQIAQPSYAGVCAAVIDELRGRNGVALVVDSFGSGPSTVKHLIELEPRCVKLDRELVSGLDRSRRKQAAVRSIVRLCAELGADVIARGVDCTAEQAAAIDCGARYAQGHVFGEPRPLPTLR